MKRKKGKRPIPLSEKYPASEPCSCDACRSFCSRPGWWTVEEAARVIKAGFGNRMMMEISPEFTFGVLSPAFKGCEGDFAQQEHSRSGCNFLREGLCELHATGLMPLECRFCHHSRSGQGLTCHNEIARDWCTEEGQLLVKKWASEYGLYEKYNINFLIKAGRPMFVLFISAFVVGLSGAMMPGSLLTYTIRKSLSEGPRAGFIIVAGHALLELALVIVIFLGFDMVLQSKAAQVGIGLVGGALLAYMGYGMIRSSAKNKLAVQMDSDKNGSGSMVVYGIVLSATNPYFLLWWAIVGLGFIMQSYNTLGFIGAGIYYLGHIAADFGWYGLISIVVGKTRRFIKERPYRIIIMILGAMLIFFGIKFVIGAVKLIA